MQRFMFRPIQHGLDLSYPSLSAPFSYAHWPSRNFKVTQHSAQKRWGYNSVDRELGAEVQAIVLYQHIDSGNRYTLYLTDADLIKKETSGKTWSYQTQTIVYTTDVASIVDKTVTLTAGDPDDDGVADGDYFILVEDYTAAEEPHRVVAYDTGDKGTTGDTPETGDTATGGTSGATGKIKLITVDGGTSFAAGDASGDLILTTCTGTWADGEPISFTDTETAVVDGTQTNTWASIASVTSSTIVLDEDYPGSTSADFGGDRTGYVRQVYTTPTGERWTWCIVHDKFIFTNGNTNVQYWDAGTSTTYATVLSSNLKKAKYCLPYANRLFVAYYGDTLDPLGIAWSKEGDPTDWTDSTSGAGVLIESRDFITGLGVVGASLVIYKTDSMAFGHRTGDAVTPISLPHTRERRGIGLVAPYSIIDFMGTNAFIGRNDFYIIEGDQPVAIGAKMRDKFFDIIDLDDIKEVYGFENHLTNELCWTANTSEGRLIFAWDYKLREWSVYDFEADFIMAGKGAIST